MTRVPTIEGDFSADGAVCVRRALTPDLVELTREAIDRVLADPSPRALRASSVDDGAFVEDFRNWSRVDVLERLVRMAPLAGIAGELLGSASVRLHHDHVLVKEAATRQPTPWHQDLPYYDLAGEQNISVWIPVDPVPAASTLEFVAGSHHGPWYMPRTFLDGEARWFPPGSLAELPDVDADPARWPVIGWALEPGDVVFFHMLTLHRAGGSTGRRRVLSLRFLGDDMVHAPRPWRTSPPFDDITGLVAGEPLDHPAFPVVWEGASS